jgi:hypothetical protein
MKAALAAIFFAAVSAGAGTLPGFRVQLLGSTSGFANSIAIDSHDTIYYTNTAGDLFRFSNGKSELVTHGDRCANRTRRGQWGATHTFQRDTSSPHS